MHGRTRTREQIEFGGARASDYQCYCFNFMKIKLEIKCHAEDDIELFRSIYQKKIKELV